MRRRRLRRRALLAGLAALVAVLALGLSLAGRDADDAPASRAAIDWIAAKNREASVVSAARLKAESDAAAAADGRISAEAQGDVVAASR